jgi:hypothetical protein
MTTERLRYPRCTFSTIVVASFHTAVFPFFWSIYWLTLIVAVGESFAVPSPTGKAATSSSPTITTTTTTTMMMKRKMKQDTEDFLAFAAAAVDLSTVHHLPNAGVLSGTYLVLYHVIIIIRDVLGCTDFLCCWFR